VRPLLQPFPLPSHRRAQAWRYQPSYRRPQHFHAEPEVNLVLRGQAQFTVGEREFSVRRGSLLVLPPGIEHEMVGASADLELFAIGYDTSLVQAWRRETGRRLALAVQCHQLDERELEKFADLCDRDPSEQALLPLLSLASELGHEGALGAQAASLLVSGALKRRDELARDLGSNRGDVSRRFHRDNGLTLQAFKNRVRVLEFLRCVDTQTDHLMRAAQLAGFGSYSQCHRIFSELVGASPKEFLASGLRHEHAARFEPANERHELPTPPRQER